MADLSTSYHLGTIILDSRHYNSWHERQWQEVQSILSEFGITISSPYAMEFEGEAYKLEGIPKHFGARDVRVYYGDTVIADATIDGSNACDSEARVTVYLSTLKAIYKAPEIS